MESESFPSALNVRTDFENMQEIYHKEINLICDSLNSELTSLKTESLEKSTDLIELQRTHQDTLDQFATIRGQYDRLSAKHLEQHECG
jgi:ABC-type transporter lipoprotein component MlaA